MEWHRTPPYGRRDRAPFALIVAITACGTLGMHLIIPALPDTARALGVSAGAIQLTITLYLIGLAIGQLLYGPISDRFGRRPVLLGGLALFTLAGIATTAAPTAWALVIARILQSIGACAGLVLGRAIVRDSAAPDRAAAQLAMLTMVMSMAPAIAPVLGGYATAWIGWRAAFALLAIIGAVTLVLAVLLLPETNRVQSGTRASMLIGSIRLFRSRAFCGYVLGGAFTTTSFYAFMAASPFILIDLLHQPTERVGLYYLC
jgi:DHA1 family bicyclomycin/chloramphenicol resistance-like MFS transporter